MRIYLVKTWSFNSVKYLNYNLNYDLCTHVYWFCHLIKFRRKIPMNYSYL